MAGIIHLAKTLAITPFFTYAKALSRAAILMSCNAKAWKFKRSL